MFSWGQKIHPQTSLRHESIWILNLGSTFPASRDYELRLLWSKPALNQTLTLLDKCRAASPSRPPLLVRPELLWPACHRRAGNQHKKRTATDAPAWGGIRSC